MGLAVFKQSIGEDKIRTLKALFEIGAQHAKKQIESLIDANILIQVPEVGIVFMSSLRNMSDDNPARFMACTMEIDGDIPGEGAILLSHNCARSLVQTMTTVDDDDLDQGVRILGELVMKNVINIVSQALSLNVTFGEAEVDADAGCDAGLAYDAEDESILVVGETNFAIASKGIAGEILLLIRLDSLSWLLEHLRV